MSVIVVVANVVANVVNVLDLQWSPSNLHMHPRKSANALHPLETLCHVPFELPGSTLAVVFPMVMSFVVSFASVPSAISLVEMSYVVQLHLV
jgi:hypothetical protein